MGFFSYRVVRSDGQVMAGVIELPLAVDSAAREHFESRGRSVLRVRRISDFGGRLRQHLERRWSRGIKRDDLIEFLRNLAVMLRSGVPILTALEETISNTPNRELVRAVDRLILSVEAGTSVSDAADQQRHVFPEAVCHLIRIGEETGSLDRTLNDAADHLTRLRQIGTDTRRSLIYPGFVFATTLGAAAFWILYVIPGVSDLFLQMQVPLPPITVFILESAEWLRRYLVPIVIGIGLCWLAAAVAIHFSRSVRHRYHQLVLRLPMAGRMAEASNLAFIAEYFSLFAASGIDILNSLKTLERTVANEVYRRRIAGIREGLERGNTLSEEFRRSRVFPPFVVRMINIGEYSGNLAEQLRYIADEYRRKLNNLVDNVSELMKPITMLLIGGFFILIVVGLFLPIYSLIGHISVTP
jgi:type II secretory pathway component PulF